MVGPPSVLKKIGAKSSPFEHHRTGCLRNLHQRTIHTPHRIGSMDKKTLFVVLAVDHLVCLTFPSEFKWVSTKVLRLFRVLVDYIHNLTIAGFMPKLPY
jgi:hypothetical protein